MIRIFAFAPMAMLTGNGFPIISNGIGTSEALIIVKSRLELFLIIIVSTTEDPISDFIVPIVASNAGLVTSPVIKISLTFPHKESVIVTFSLKTPSIDSPLKFKFNV